MVWDKIKEMNLYDKISDDLKQISSHDSEVVERYITDTDGLKEIKSFMRQGWDSSRIGQQLGLTINQVDIIKELLGKLN
ncbi:hypothetical protein SAMN02745163_03153 [Clostridium cavendishii DSM 21758]|uniref:Uncharacterized protein n=1 Tax=Clostridium cavendishii DSM 21758 TaxID=1121302 RepID=A0A1M6PGX6_9CLOT|nr:hypothetical protein [Clostridium cavendishii]SHK07183.1 hypothetical protein SAMN02745163_03153 [Clostridium cavendishii DSM 21758]